MKIRSRKMMRRGNVNERKGERGESRRRKEVEGRKERERKSR